jgi:carbonic anhydrase
MAEGDDMGALLGRRRFLRLALAGAGTALVGVPSRKAAGAATEGLLLSCMDFRLVNDTVRYMNGRGLQGTYDHVILAGAALGAQTDKYPDWGRTFWQHLGVAIDLHGITRVYLLDHRDCGAYQVILGEDLAKDPAEETEVHSRELRKLGRAIRTKHPKLEVELLLMSLDGSVETIA